MRIDGTSGSSRPADWGAVESGMGGYSVSLGPRVVDRIGWTGLGLKASPPRSRHCGPRVAWWLNYRAHRVARPTKSPAEGAKCSRRGWGNTRRWDRAVDVDTVDKPV